MKKFILFFVSLLMPYLVNPHHSEAAFDMDQIVSFPATIKEYRWRNPHVYIVVETEVNGILTEWQIETGATPIMSRSGWNESILIPGESIFVRVHPERSNRRNYAMLVALQKENGLVLSQNPSSLIEQQPRESIFGTWRATQESIDRFFQSLASMNLTQAGQDALKVFDWQTQSPAAGCIAYTIPRSYIASNLFLTRIVDEGDFVSIESEYFDVRRTIPLINVLNTFSNNDFLHQGVSTGTFSDNELIVRTDSFLPNIIGNGNGIPSSNEKVTLERYYLSDNRSRLRLDFSLEDPAYIETAFAGYLEFEPVADENFYAYQCDIQTSSEFMTYE